MNPETPHTDWTNQSTSLAHLHLTNNPHTYQDITDYTSETPIVRAEDLTETEILEGIAAYCKLNLDALTMAEPAVRTDFMSVGTLWINWNEIAAAFLLDFDEDQ